MSASDGDGGAAPGQPAPRRRCARCGQAAAGPLAWRCGCGGAYEYDWQPTFDPARIERGVWSQSRYRALLLPPALQQVPAITLGEGMTPLVRRRWSGRPVTFKLDFLMPTASYKDRGSATLLTVLAAEGHRRLVEDSSGNAGASIAAYAAAAGIGATIFVPAHAAAGKKEQIRAFGATLREIPGPRHATSDACHAAASGTLYASHAWHPAFLLGQVAAAWELWEQSGGRLPDLLVFPVGQGGMLLGYDRGLRALERAGLIDRRPALVGVQAAPCAPVTQAWAAEAPTVAPVAEGETIAGGVRIAAPARGDQILAAIRRSGGMALTATDDEIRAAHRRLAREGLFVEPTSALPAAALDRLFERIGGGVEVLLPLSGSGLKVPPASGGSGVG